VIQTEKLDDVLTHFKANQCNDVYQEICSGNRCAQGCYKQGRYIRKERESDGYSSSEGKGQHNDGDASIVAFFFIRVLR